MDKPQYRELLEREFQREISSPGWKARCCAGDAPAIAETLRLCGLYKQPPPDWLVDAAAVKLADSMPDQERRLRHAFATHRERWEAVSELRERRDALKSRSLEQREELRRGLRNIGSELRKELHDERREELREQRELLEPLFLEWAIDDRGESLNKAFAAVAEAFACSEDTVEASYKLIEDAGGQDATLDRYRLAIRQRNRRG
jgi:hypothetical protein